MTDPRLDVSFEGIGAEHASYKIDNSTITYDATKDGGSDQVGLAVNLSAGKTVQLVGDGEVVLGKLVKVEPDGVANVQTGGYVTLPGGEGATLTPGKKIVGDLGPSSAEGYIREVTDASGTPTQAEVNEIARSRGIIVDASDTTAVVVRL